MSDIALAEFQSAAVETICSRLTDRGGSRRFLLADEVGLGKTVVARGVTEFVPRRLLQPVENSAKAAMVKRQPGPAGVGRSASDATTAGEGSSARQRCADPEGP